MRVIPEFLITLTPLTEDAKNVRKFKWADEKIGNRHKIGGKPDFIQGEDFPCCDFCHKTMTFYAQLDAVGADFSLADCGLIYLFICFDCNETKSFIQSY